ncbi:MAG: M48 family metalloprotease [Pseudomonadota bacterium]
MTKHLVWILLALALALSAAIAMMAPVAQGGAARANAQIAGVDDAWRAALPLDPQAATKAYMARIPAAAKARSDAYFEGGYWLQLFDFALGLVVAAILLRTRAVARCRDRIVAKVRVKWLSDAFTAMCYLVMASVLALPMTVYEEYYREHAFGLSNQSAAGWFTESLINLGVTVVSAGLAFGILYIALRRARRNWWLWGALLGVVLVGLSMLLGPMYIEPMFNTYQPITDAKVKGPVLSMMRANGVPVDNIYQFDASRQSDRVSANVAGIFGSAAVRLNDNLLKRSSVAEIKAVLGHELGHYTMNHIYKGWIEIALLLVFGLAFLKCSLDLAIGRWGSRLGIADAADIAGLPLFIALFSAYMFVATPVRNSLTRTQEVEADVFGLNAAAEPLAFAEVMLKLTEYRKSDPTGAEEFVFFDHPSPRKRIYGAMRWRAEHASQ